MSAIPNKVELGESSSIGLECIKGEDLGARRLFAWASTILNPYCRFWEYNYYRLRLPLDTFNCLPDRAREIGVRVATVIADCVLFAAFCYAPRIVGSLVVVGPLGFLALRGVAARLQYKGKELGGFCHLKGAAQEKDFTTTDGNVTMMTLNVAALAAGLSYGFAGVRPWEDRIDGIVAMIREEHPDVLVLQEVMDTDFSNALIEKLGDEFAHFFAHLGVSPKFPFSGGFAPGGVMIATKGAVHHFSDHPFASNTGEQCRGFGCLELLDKPEGAPFARFVGTHPCWKEEDAERRMLQWQQIKQCVEGKGDTLPTFLLADTNSERDGEEGTKLKEWLQFYYEGENAKEPTCYHWFPSQWKKDGRFLNENDATSPRQIDNIAWVKKEGKGPECLDCHLKKSFSKLDTGEALSDHHGVVVRVKVQREDV